MSYQDVILADSPLLYWRLDETSGAYTELGSLSGAIAHGSGITRGVAGIPAGGNATQFNDSTTGQSYVSKSISYTYLNNSYSIEMWVKTTKTANTLWMYSTGPWAYGSVNESGKANFQHIDSGGQLAGTTTITDNQWHHLVFTYTSGTRQAKLYVDGVLEATGTRPAVSLTTNSTLNISEVRANSYAVNGTVDEFAMYPSVLTSTQVQAHYNAGTQTAVNASFNAATATISVAAKQPVVEINQDTEVVLATATGSTVANNAIVEAYGTDTQTVTVGATYDAQHNAGTGGVVGGPSANSIRIEGGSAFGRNMALLQFSKSAMFGSNPVVLSQATLKVYVHSRNGAPAFSIAPVGQESSAFVTYPEPAAGTEITFDVTSIIENTSGDTVTIDLLGNGSTDSRYLVIHSSESTTSAYRPKLTALFEPAQVAADVSVSTATVSAKVNAASVQTSGNVDVSVATALVSASAHEVIGEINNPIPVDGEVLVETAGASAAANEASFEELRTVTISPSYDTYRRAGTDGFIFDSTFLEINTNDSVYASPQFIPQGGSATEHDYVRRTLERLDYPLDTLKSAIHTRYGRDHIIIEFADLPPGDSNGTVLGQFSPTQGKITLDHSLTVLLEIFAKVLIHEIAHAVDHLVMTNSQRVDIWNAFHEGTANVVPAGTVITNGTEVTAGEGWLDYGTYGTRVGEAFSNAFIKAYSNVIFDENQFSHPATNAVGDKVRQILTPSLGYTRGPLPTRTAAMRLHFNPLQGDAVMGTIKSAVLRLNVEQNVGGGNYGIKTIYVSGESRSAESSATKTINLPVGVNNIDVSDILNPKKFNVIHVGASGTGSRFVRATSLEGAEANEPKLVLTYAVAQGAQLVDADTPTATATSHEPVVEAVVSPDVYVDAETALIEFTAGDAQAGSPTVVDVDTAGAALTAHDATVEINTGATVDVDTPRITANIFKVTDVNGEPVLPSESEDPYFVSTMRTVTGYTRGTSGGVQGTASVLDPSLSFWYRFNERFGTLAYDRLTAKNQGGEVINEVLQLNNVVIGLNDGPEGRHNFHFNGDAYAVQPQEFGKDELWYFPSGIEFTFRTERKTQFLMGGSDQEADLNTDNAPPWELWLVDGVLELRQYTWDKTINNVLTVKGHTDLADGDWHHVVIQNSHEGTQRPGTANFFAMEMYVDANLEVRRRTGVGPQGFPDRIGARPDNYYSGYPWAIEAPELAKSHWFLGDMTEIIYRNGRTLNDDEIAVQRDNLFGIFAVRPETARVTLKTDDNIIAKGNKPRVLALHFTQSRAVAERGMKFPLTNQALMAHAGVVQEDIALAAQRELARNGGILIDFVGYGEQATPLGVGPSGNYLWFHESVWENDGKTYRDPITDNHRLIDLNSDLNMDDYDIISIVGYPKNEYDWSLFDQLDAENAQPMVPMRQQLERLMGQVKAEVIGGKSLFVNDPASAIALGVVDRVEYVPNVIEKAYYDARLGAVTGIFDWRSAEVDIFNGAKPEIPEALRPDVSDTIASRYEDTHANIKQRVRALVPGLTDIAGAWIHTDEIRWWNINPMGNPPYHTSRHFENRFGGLYVGDEFFMAGGYWEDKKYTSLYLNNLEREIGWVASPVRNVKVGTVVTTFGNVHYNYDEAVGNPYGDYAVSIAIQPGDLWDGQTVAGKAYINFTEAYTHMAEMKSTSHIQQRRDRGFAEGIGTGDQIVYQDGGRWIIGPEHLFWQFSTHFGSNQGSQVTLPGGPSDSDWGWSPGGTRGGSGGGPGAGHAMQWRWRSFVPLEELWTPTMAERGLLWLASDLDVAGNANINAETAEVSAQSAEATVETEANAFIDLSTARVTAESYNDADTIDPDVTVLVGTAAVTVKAHSTVNVVDVSTAKISASAYEPETEEMPINWSEALIMTLPRQQLTLVLEDALT